MKVDLVRLRWTLCLLALLSACGWEATVPTGNTGRVFPAGGHPQPQPCSPVDPACY